MAVRKAPSTVSLVSRGSAQTGLAVCQCACSRPRKTSSFAKPREDPIECLVSEARRQSGGRPELRREEEDRLLGETRFYRVFPIPAMSSPPFLRGHFLTHRGRYNSERRQRKYAHTHARVHCATVLCRLKERSWLPPGLHRLARTNGPFFFRERRAFPRSPSRREGNGNSCDPPATASSSPSTLH